MQHNLKNLENFLHKLSALYGKFSRQCCAINWSGECNSDMNQDSQNTAATAIVGTARLILVILICVLLVKLRAPKNAKRYHLFKHESQQHQQQTSSDIKQLASSPLLKHLKLPPGPMGLPFVGYMPFVGNEIHLTLTSLSDRYGPIYQIFLGGIRVVVLNDASLVRQAFKQPVFSGRPDTQLTRILQGYGIVNSEGALWKEQRAFLHTTLRKLGAKSLMSGSNGLEAKIQVSIRSSSLPVPVAARWLALAAAAVASEQVKSVWIINLHFCFPNCPLNTRTFTDNRIGPPTYININSG